MVGTIRDLFMTSPLRLLLMIRWPNKIKPGITSDEMVQNLDYAQTFLEAAMIEAPNDMQGESLIPILKGERS